MPRLAPASWFAVPELLADDPLLGAIVITGLRGDIVGEGGLPSADRIVAYELAGRFAACLHALPLDTAGLPPLDEVWIGLRAAAFDYDRTGLDSETIAWARSIPAGPPSPGGVYSAVHHDYSPRNWLFHRGALGPVLGVIDWERSRPAHFGTDLQRMSVDWWIEDPALERAFFKGYGRVLTDIEWVWVYRNALYHALGGITWAIDHDDSSFAAANRIFVQRLQARMEGS